MYKGNIDLFEHKVVTTFVMKSLTLKFTVLKNGALFFVLLEEVFLKSMQKAIKYSFEVVFFFNFH